MIEERERLSGDFWKFTRKLKAIPQTKSNWIYVIYNPANNLYKIGIGQDVRNRYLSIQAQSGYKLNLLIATCPHFEDENPKILERWLHEKYKSQRVSGEWFKLSSKDFDKLYEFLIGDIEPDDDIDNIVYPDKIWLQATNGR